MNREGERAKKSVPICCAPRPADHRAQLALQLGEIDLIAEERGTLVFAEVRMRSAALFGGAAESVTAAKKQRLVAAARLYLARRPDASCRFDVFLVDGAPSHVQWIRNAFCE